MGYICATGFEEQDSTYGYYSGWGGGFSSSHHAGGSAKSLYCFSNLNNASNLWVGLTTAVAEAWASVWIYWDGGGNGRAGFASDNYITLASPMVITSGGSLTSAVNFLTAGWHHLFMHIKVATAPNGIFEFRLDGGTLQTFTGNTKPSATTVNQVYAYTYSTGASNLYLDDITVRDDTWPDPLNYILKYPNGNDSVAWTPSAGSNYQCVDETPPSDADYVSSVANADVDLYTCNSLSLGTGGVPKVVTQYIRGKKETPDPGSVDMIVDLLGTQDVSADVALTTSFTSSRRILPLAPGGVAWDATNINQIKIGEKSVI
jgi:hypothetical protein